MPQKASSAAKALFRAMKDKQIKEYGYELDDVFSDALDMAEFMKLAGEEDLPSDEELEAARHEASYLK